MSLARQFCRAEIKKVGTCYYLKIYYTWYWVASFDETFVFESLVEAQDKLMSERCRGMLKTDT